MDFVPRTQKNMTSATASTISATVTTISRKTIIKPKPETVKPSSNNIPLNKTIIHRNLTEQELRRRELAKKEAERRERIQKQIELQRERDLVAKRQAIIARKDLANRLQIEAKENAGALAVRKQELELIREREEKAKQEELIRQRILREKQRAMAERRAKVAREELLRRRTVEPKLKASKSVRIENSKSSSTDPLSLGSLQEFEDDIEALEREVEKTIDEQPDTSENNSKYILGGKSPFINTTVEKRPLSGGKKDPSPTMGYSRSANRFVPYEEPKPHKNIYARALTRKDQDDSPEFVNKVPTKLNIFLIIAIILTVIFGALIGSIIYLAFFQ